MYKIKQLNQNWQNGVQSGKIELLKKVNNILLIELLNNESMTIGYCVKCRDKRDIQGAKPYTMKNGKPAIKGTCPACSTAIFRIGRG